MHQENSLQVYKDMVVWTCMSLLLMSIKGYEMVTFSSFFIIKHFKPFPFLSLQLCFAHKGILKDEVGMKFTYLNSQGLTMTETTKINTLFNKGQTSVILICHYMMQTSQQNCSI